MNLQVIVHKAEEGGYWAEVPAIKGCMSEGDTWDELIANIHEAVNGCLSVPIEHPELESNYQILEMEF